MASLVGEMLVHLGHIVLRAGSASGALGALSDDRRIDLMFSDVMMPGGMDGLGLAREVRMRRPHLPVLLTSGYPEVVRNEAEIEGLQLLPKPYSLEALRAALAEAVQTNAY